MRIWWSSIRRLTGQRRTEMVGKMDGLEAEQRTDEAVASVFREVLGQRPGYTRGLGEMVISEPIRQRDCEREREYLALIEKHKKDANNYKTQLDEMRDEMQVLHARKNETNKMLRRDLEQLLMEQLDRNLECNSRAAVGTVGHTVAYPLDVIRRRMQMVGRSNAASIVTSDGRSKAPLEYTGIFANIQKISSI